MHWAAKYIGRPHVPGARGPSCYDCWGLLRAVYQNEFQTNLPDLPGISAESVHVIHSTLVSSMQQEWKEIQIPVDGCAVAMSQRKVFHHVGVWIGVDGCSVLHCWEAQNVIADTIRSLRLKGFLTIKFYHYGLSH